MITLFRTYDNNIIDTCMSLLRLATVGELVGRKIDL